MRCPKCAGKSKTLDTREYRGSPTIMRRHKCLECGHRFRTFEIHEDEYSLMNTNNKFVNEIVGMMRSVEKRYEGYKDGACDTEAT